VSLGDEIAPCGPVIDTQAAQRTRERLLTADLPDEARAAVERAWSALEPVFGASPYLAGIARRRPGRLAALLQADPAQSLARLIAGVRGLDGQAGPLVAEGLRRLKTELHLLTALADLGGVWDLEAVTGALSRFADEAVAAALACAGREAADSGVLLAPTDPGRGPVPGLFAVAMGKLGADELNYSSDIDINLFYEPAAFAIAGQADHARVAQRLGQRLIELLQARTAAGYVFRVDLRLRPDPLSTPPVVGVPAALDYYQTVGQNWERAAFIKARPLAGDLPLARGFLEELQGFVWRRNLDFAAIADIQSIKRQIHVFKVDERLTARGADLKLGRGGIREIEFYAQTLQLIHGGRDPSLRAPATLAALRALSAAGRIAPEAAAELSADYQRLRRLEHRAQMIADDQTHRLPEADGDRRRIAALDGFQTLGAFDTQVGRLLWRVNRRYGALFAEAEPLSSAHGSLVFTGVEDDPETLATLRRMGFVDPARVSREIRGWHHGRIRATRSARERELFTRLAPRLLEAAAATGAADAAFARFGDFFCALVSSIQIQSLFLAHPKLLDLVVRVLAFAPRFARTLAQRPAALDTLLDPQFFGEIGAAIDVAAAIGRAEGFEAAMDEARRVHADSAFRIGAQVLAGRSTAYEAGRAFADLADGVIAALAPAALAEIERTAGRLDGAVAVIALGACGAREMNARSDLDLMTLYAGAPAAASAVRDWSPETFYARFTQRLLAALSALTPAGRLYDVDLRLRPSGSAGPVAVSAAAFERYYAGEAETWEFLALCKARVVWATTADFGARTADRIEAALRRPRDAGATARDVRAMRGLMAKERPAQGPWDMKLSRGGLVDIEFCAHFLQLAAAAAGGRLRQNTGEALDALLEARPAGRGPLQALKRAWSLQTSLSQMLKIALDDGADPAAEPEGFRKLLARTGGARTFGDLEKRLAAARAGALQAFERLVEG
jgi:glutamate-ammonia-ligase adenylyltransferase